MNNNSIMSDEVALVAAMMYSRVGAYAPGEKEHPGIFRAIKHMMGEDHPRGPNVTKATKAQKKACRKMAKASRKGNR